MKLIFDESTNLQFGFGAQTVKHHLAEPKNKNENGIASAWRYSLEKTYETYTEWPQSTQFKHKMRANLRRTARRKVGKRRRRRRSNRRKKLSAEKLCVHFMRSSLLHMRHKVEPSVCVYAVLMCVCVYVCPARVQMRKYLCFCVAISLFLSFCVFFLSLGSRCIHSIDSMQSQTYITLSTHCVQRCFLYECVNTKFTIFCC